MKVVGVIGLGSIGARHAKNLLALGHHVVAHDPNPLQALPDELTGVPFFDLDMMMSLADAVIIASPSDQHIDGIRRAINANKPMLIEKPIATQLTAELHGYLFSPPPMMVGYNLRFHPSVVRAKKWIDDGEIGTPLWAKLICAQFNDKPAYQRDGVILNWSHEIDLALYLLGPAVVTHARARKTESNEDIADIMLSHTNGADSLIHLDYVAKPEVRTTLIVGTGGTINLDLPERYAWLRREDGSQIDCHAGGSWDGDYVSELQAFIRRAQGETVPGATAADGLAALEIALAARKRAGLS